MCRVYVNDENFYLVFISETSSTKYGLSHFSAETVWPVGVMLSS